MKFGDQSYRVAVILPCYNEEAAIGDVVRDFRAALPEAVVYVYDNNSKDGTVLRARAAGAVVRSETRQGKGQVVRRMFADVEADIYVLADGDGTYDAASAPAFVEKLLSEQLDMVVGSRLAQGPAEDAMPAHSRLATVVVCKKLSFLLRSDITDLGPFRAFRFRALRSLDMSETTYGWTVEMTIKAYRKGLKVKEVPVRYRRRLGKAKISGTTVSSLKALMSMMRCMVKYTIQWTP